MRSRSAFDAVVSLTLLLVPLSFWPWSFLVFELPKVTLFRSATLLLFFIAMFMLIKSQKVLLPVLKENKMLILCLITGILWFVAMVSATITSIAPSISFFGEYHKLQGLFTWFHIFLWTGLTVLFLKKESRIPMLTVLSIGSFIISIYAIIQQFGIDPISLWKSESFLGRVFGTMGHPNYLGSYLILTIPITFALSVRTTDAFWKFASFANMTVQFLALLFTLSRAAWLGLIIGTLSAIALYTHLFRKKTFIKIAIGIASLATIVAITNISHRYYPLDTVPVVKRLLITEENARSIESRTNIWASAKKTIDEHPWLGNGPETFFMTFTKYQPKELLALEAFTETADRGHNQDLDMASSIGIPGTTAYILTIIFLIIAALTKLKHEQEKEERVLILSLIAGIIALEIAHRFGFPTITHLMIFWFFAGLLIQYSSTFKEKHCTFFPSSLKILMIITTSIFSIVLIWNFNLKTIYADTYFNKGKFLLEHGYPQQGLSLYEKTTALNPIAHFYWLHSAYAYSLLVEKGWTNDKITALGNAQKALSQAKKIAPADYNVYLLGGQIETELAKLDMSTIETAFRTFEKGLEHAPYNPQLHFYYAKSAYELGDYRKAIDLYENLLSLSPDYWKKDPSSLSSKEREKERIFFKLNPLFRSIFLYLGRSYSLLNDFEKALFYLQYAEPSVDTYTTYATIFSFKSDFEKAREYTLKALELDPKNQLLKENLKKLNSEL